MKLSTPIPAPITWILRIVGWAVGLVLIFVAYAFFANIRIARHAETCLQLDTATRRPGNALAVTQGIAACLDRESGWAEQPMLYLQKRAIATPGPAPCKYLGEWKATRDPNVIYDVTLAADRTFIARAVMPREAETLTGAWLARGNRIAWLYDSMPGWPPDDNLVKDASDGAFSLVERNGSLTHYRLVRQIEAAGCAPE